MTTPSGPPDTRPPGHPPPPPPPPPFSGARAATAMATLHADAGPSCRSFSLPQPLPFLIGAA